MLLIILAWLNLWTLPVSINFCDAVQCMNQIAEVFLQVELNSLEVAYVFKHVSDTTE